MSSRKKKKGQQEDCAVCILVIHTAKSNNENVVSCSVDGFEKMLDIKRRRVESTTEALRMADICVQIPIATDVVRSNIDQGEVYIIFRFWFPPPLKLTATI